MINATAIGYVGKDAELRDAGNTRVCNFSLGSTEKKKGEDVTTWLRCSVFGTRGEKLAPHLKKGSKVAVSGTLSSREYNGKTYLEMRVNEIEFAGAKPNGTAQKREREEPEEDSRQDDLPF